MNGLVAATAIANDLIVATLDDRDCDGLGIDLVDP